jgi:hypothetical protein
MLGPVLLRCPVTTDDHSGVGLTYRRIGVTACEPDNVGRRGVVVGGEYPHMGPRSCQLQQRSSSREDSNPPVQAPTVSYRVSTSEAVPAALPRGLKDVPGGVQIQAFVSHVRTSPRQSREYWPADSRRTAIDRRRKVRPPVLSPFHRSVGCLGVL